MSTIVLDVAPRIVLYIDEHVVRIPMSGGLPFAVVGRTRYTGLDELRMLAAELA